MVAALQFLLYDKVVVPFSRNTLLMSYTIQNHTFCTAGSTKLLVLR
jgi:hypothetical protein